MKKYIGIILILGSIYLGYVGIDKYNNSGESVEIFDAEISVEDKQGKSSAYAYMGAAALAFIGGIYLVGKGKS